MAAKLSLMEGMVLDMTAEGKTPRQIAEVLGITPTEAAKMAYDLLDREIVTDVEQRRKLNVYRLEKLIDALWERTMRNANEKDVKNIIDIIDKMNVLMGLNKEQDLEMRQMMHAHQLAAYLAALKGLIVAFKQIAPHVMTEEEWAVWSVEQLEQAKDTLTVYELEQ